jgi:hypothetical protein
MAPPGPPSALCEEGTTEGEVVMIGTVELPTKGHYQGTLGVVKEAHGAVESIACWVAGVKDATGKPPELETAADVRLLLSFTEELVTHVREMNAWAEMLVQKLAGVDVAQLKEVAGDPYGASEPGAPGSGASVWYPT